MNFAKLIEELRENADILKAGLTAIEDRLDVIEDGMLKAREGHLKIDKKLDLVLLYLKKMEVSKEVKTEI